MFSSGISVRSGAALARLRRSSTTWPVPVITGRPRPQRDALSRHPDARQRRQVEVGVDDVEGLRQRAQPYQRRGGIGRDADAQAGALRAATGRFGLDLQRGQAKAEAGGEAGTADDHLRLAQRCRHITRQNGCFSAAHHDRRVPGSSRFMRCARLHLKARSNRQATFKR